MAATPTILDRPTQRPWGRGWVRFFSMIRISIRDPRSPGSWCIKRTTESTLDNDSAVPLIHHDPSDLGSLILIRIIPKERTLRIEGHSDHCAPVQKNGIRSHQNRRHEIAARVQMSAVCRCLQYIRGVAWDFEDVHTRRHF